MLRARKAFWSNFYIRLFIAVIGIIFPRGSVQGIGDNIQYWSQEFPYGDFTRRIVEISEIRSHGATRDSIQPIVKPSFDAEKRYREFGKLEPVISIEIDLEARAYPLRFLIWHELVNDEVAGIPILVSYSPLTNSARVYDRRVGGKETLFGNTGRTRHFDTILYDAATQSWWQRYTGRAIFGARVGSRLKPLVSRIESIVRFRAQYPNGKIMLPANLGSRPYGTTPYIRMGSSSGEGLEAYVLADEIKPYDRVVVVGDEAWTYKRLREKGSIERSGLFIGWAAGLNSVHDTKWIQFGRDIGNIVVRRFDVDNEEWIDALHTVSFAFAFGAFHPSGVLYSW